MSSARIDAHRDTRPDATDDRELRDHIAEEYRDRLERGESPTIAEYLARYPEHAASLEDLLTAVDHLAASVPSLPTTVGRYEVRREIARGGMGVVYEAHDPELDRTVALKVLPVHLDSADSRERFRREVQSAARLEHPDIVRVYGSGEADGLRYYAMQYIEGDGLDRVIEAARRADRRPDWSRSIARMMVPAARALHFAHTHGVLHRDIKPSNLIIDESGGAHLTDFGLSKSLEWADLTRTYDVVGTLRYLAPERFAGVSDVRSDVHALGLVLYEALTLEPAVRSRDRAAIVREITADTPIPPRRLDPTIPRDLETIVLTAIRPEPGARYATAEALALDLEAFLDDRPIRARRPGAVRRLLLGARRNRRLTATVLVATALLIGGGVQYLARTGALLDRHRSLALSRSASEAVERDPMLGLLLAREAVACHRDATTLSTLARALAALHEYALLTGHRREVRWCEVVGERVISGSDDSIRTRDFDGKPIGAIEAGPFLASAVDPTRGLIAYATDDRLVLHDGEQERASARFEGEPLLLHFDAPGSVLIAAADRRILRWIPPAAPVEVCTVTGRAVSLGSSPAHDAFSVSTWADGVQVYEGSGELRWLWQPARHSHRQAWSPDGQRLAVDDGHRVMLLAGGKVSAQLMGHDDDINSIVFSPAGDRILTSSADQTARLWSLDGTELAVLDDHGSSVEAGYFAPDGARILTVSADQTARLWSAAGEPIARLAGHDDSLVAGGFSPDGTRVATASADRTLRLWRVQPEGFTVFRGHEAGIYTAVFAPDGERVLTASRDSTARIWDLEGRELHRLQLPSYLCSAEYSSDDGAITATTMGGTAHHYDSEGRPGAIFTSPRRRVLCAWKIDGADRYLVRTGDERGMLVDANGKELLVLEGHESYLWAAEYDPKSHRLLTTSDDGTARAWDATTGRLLATLRGHDELVRSASASPVDDRIVTAGDDGTARVWSATGHELVVLRGHDGPVLMATFSPDGERIVTASRDGTARIWGAKDGELRLVLQGHAGVVWSARFSPDGRRVITSSFDRTARIWLTEPDDLLEAARCRATRRFTRSEWREYGELLEPR